MTTALTTTTNQNPGQALDMSALPLLAILKKGAPKPKNGNKPGRELEYFRPEWRSDDPYLQQIFIELYGPEPDRLIIRFLDDDPFMDSYEAWHGNNTLKARHNGQHYIKRWTGTGYDFTPAPLDDAAKECKRVGRLQFSLPDFFAQTLEVGYFMALTTSDNDCRHISAVIQFARRTGILQRVDFELFRYPRHFTVPINGAPSKITKYMIGLKINRDSARQYQLSAGNGAGKTTDPETGEIVYDREQDASIDGYFANQGELLNWAHTALYLNKTEVQVRAQMHDLDELIASRSKAEIESLLCEEE